LKTYKTPNRRNLRTKMASALNDDMGTLPAAMKSILIDDLVTAFESRLKALATTQSNISFIAHTQEAMIREVPI
jgi:hypothetical protein